MTISGRHFDESANVIVDGRRVSGTVSLDDGEKVAVTLSTLPSVGIHLLQIQDSNGMFSNDFIFYVAENAEAAAELKRRTDREHVDVRDALAAAVSRGDLDETKQLLGKGSQRINERQPASGGTALGAASLHGRLDMVKYLIERGAKVEATNRDGNTPLHVAAFMCQAEIVKLLIEKGSSPLTKNGRGETVIDVVSSDWNQQLADFYTGIGNAVDHDFDLDKIREERPRIAQLLRDHIKQSEE